MAFTKKHRLCETSFTRSRKLDFKTFVTFLLNHCKDTTRTDLYRFFAELLDDDMPFRYITKSAYFQARKQLSHEAFSDLNHHFVDTRYSSKSKAVKRWHGHRVCAVGGNQTSYGAGFRVVRCP
jgi:hypothetical protein